MTNVEDMLNDNLSQLSAEERKTAKELLEVLKKSDLSIKESTALLENLSWEIKGDAYKMKISDCL